MDPNERLQYPLPEEELLREIQKVRRSFFITEGLSVYLYLRPIQKKEKTCECVKMRKSQD